MELFCCFRHKEPCGIMKQTNKQLCGHFEGHYKQTACAILTRVCSLDYVQMLEGSHQFDFWALLTKTKFPLLCQSHGNTSSFSAQATREQSHVHVSPRVNECGCAELRASTSLCTDRNQKWKAEGNRRNHRSSFKFADQSVWAVTQSTHRRNAHTQRLRVLVL